MAAYDIFSVFEHADDSSLCELERFCEPLDSDADRRIFARIQEKCHVRTVTENEEYEDVVEGVDQYMKRPVKKALAAAAVLLVIAGGAAGGLALLSQREHIEPTSRVKEEDKINTTEYSLSTSRCIDSTYNFYKNGRIFYDSVSSIAKYTDFESMKTVPLCSRPNCNHKNNECVAKLIGETPIVYNDKVYYLTYEDGVKENKYGKREYYVNSKLNCVSMETSEIKNIVEFHDCTPQLYGGYYLDGNNLYFVATDMGVEENEYGNIIYSNVGGKQFLCSVDLENGQYTNHGIIYERDIEYEGAKNSRCAFIAGGRNSKINIFYSFLPDLLSPNGDITAKDFIMLGVNFDINTKTFSEGEEISPSFSDEDSFVGYDNKAGIMYIDYNGKKTEFEVEDRDEVSVINGKFFDANKGIWIDLDSNKEYSMGKYNGYIAITLWNGYYILTKGANTVKLTEEELKSL